MTSARPSARRRGRLALIALLPVTPLLLAPGWAASADDPAPVPADGSHYVTVEFDYTGTPESFTVPAGVTSLEVTAYGASGGSATADFEPSSTALGGRGAAVSALLDVVPGTVLSVNVGGQGGPNDTGGGAAGWNGGGSGGVATMVGAGGGGATDLRSCAPDAPECDSLASRLLVAAGGGGAGFSQDTAFVGADAGVAGTDFTGVRGTVHGGGAGTATDGGAGGASDDEFDRISSGGPGTLGVGGVGGGATGPDASEGGYRGAGGGGGGLYGGGGGGDNRYYGAPGGGGSSLVPSGGGQGLAGPDTDGLLIISYDLGPVTEVTLAAEPLAIAASGSATTTVTATSHTGSGVGVEGLAVSFASTDPGHTFDPVTDNGDGSYSAVLHGSQTVGDATITATAAGNPDVVGTTTLTQEAYTAPAIAAATDSTKPRSAAGWWRAPVLVTFTCSGSRPITPSCPTAVLVDTNGPDQTLVRSVTDDQGNAATVTVSLDIDRRKPVVKVTGAKDGATYGSARRLTCRATDTLSGVRSCKVATTRRQTARGTRVSWTGTAVDQASNTSVTKGGYTIRRQSS